MVENKNKSGDKPKTEKMIFTAKNKSQEYYIQCLLNEFTRYQAELIVAVEMEFISKEAAEKILVTSYEETPELMDEVKTRLKNLRKLFDSPVKEAKKESKLFEEVLKLSRKSNE